MVEMTSVEKLLLTLGAAPDQEALLGVIYADVETDIRTWTNRQTLPPGLESAVRQLAILRYNKLGIEGETSHSEGGVSRSFEALPLDLQQTISHYRLLKVVGRYAAP